MKLEITSVYTVLNIGLKISCAYPLKYNRLGISPQCYKSQKLPLNLFLSEPVLEWEL